ncbi:MAG: 50S ribosomal protein L29 [candidate division Zixibacteria bacterium DG_27]|nr:MAG: 50S ribosomal protein L29 [candidate division Zixibacteria bacterium DG_27]
MRPRQIRDLTTEEILQRKRDLEEELFNLRLRQSTQYLDNPLKVRTLRRELARVNTILKEGELGIRKLAADSEE